jgi:hypothetical protein
MPNGGSDCCGTCWFNSKNKGKTGSPGAKSPGVVCCTIRDIEIPDPFWTYCANHPGHNRSKCDLPLGPVYVNDGYPYRRKVWLNPPDNERIRVKLLELLENISTESNVIEQEYPSERNIDEEIINQLMALNERRAVSGLLKIINMDIEKYRFWDKDNLELKPVKNKAVIVGQAIEALLTITGGEYLIEVEKFINKGLENLDNTYDVRCDNFAIIRYHLVRGLRYVNSNKAVELLTIAKSDPHDEVRAFAGEILSTKIMGGSNTD